MTLGRLGTIVGTMGVTPAAVLEEGGVARLSPGPPSAERGGRRRASPH